MLDARWFPALMVFSTVVFGTVALALTWEVLRDWRRRRQTAKRLKRAMSLAPLRDSGALDLLRGKGEGEGLFSSLVRNLPWLPTVQNLMRQSRLDWSVETFMLLSVGLGFGCGLGALVIGQSFTIALLVAAVGAWLPYFDATRRRNSLFAAFEEQFPEAIELLTRAIRAGHPLSAGMKMVSQEAPEVVAEEFGQMFEEQRFGLPFTDALLGMVDRMNMVDVRIFVIAVLVQREVGGNLAEILENLAETIRSRFYIRRQLRVYTAQGRLSGWILALLPIVVGSVIFLMQPDYVMTLFVNMLGIVLLIVAGTLQILGIFWIRRIVDIEI